MTNPSMQRHLGQTSLSASILGFGGGTLGDPTEIIEDQVACDTIEAAVECGINYFDTAPWYGLGKSELRLGNVLRSIPRETFVLTTKVGRVLIKPEGRNGHVPFAHRWAGGLPFDVRFDYTRQGVLRSYEDSLKRLGMASLDALVIHDLDRKFHLSEEEFHSRLDELDFGGGFAALAELKESGQIKAIGVGVNHMGMIPLFLDRFAIDYVLLAMPYTLLHQDALDGELDRCVQDGVSVVIGAVFCTGILATGVAGRPVYRYGQAPPSIVEKTRRIEAVCQRHAVPLGAVALQFPLHHPAVVSVIPGANSPEIVRQNYKWLQMSIPIGLWQELKEEGLLRHDAPTPERVESLA
jgi:D-threo-aldose 1-dehydrogenase